MSFFVDRVKSALALVFPRYCTIFERNDDGSGANAVAIWMSFLFLKPKLYNEFLGVTSMLDDASFAVELLSSYR